MSAFSLSERVVAAASVLTVIGTFLPWKAPPTATVLTNGGENTISTGATLNGLHSWGLLTLLIALAALAYLFVRSPFFRGTLTPPRLPFADPVAYLLAGCGEIATVLLFSSHYPGGSIKLGFMLAVLGGGLTVLGGYLGMRAGTAAPVMPVDEFEEVDGGVDRGVHGGGGPPGGIQGGGPPTMPG